ncbi:hypothetical protein FOG18_02610 [Legionella israelensis]|uniref:hypothetical protein n=1 Tax=Legionella israelensis TaxID=454 RepID=UPI0011807F7C|nr:hypothetical protein [Legionella israelensis]QDP71542.1 hypothetical protein FOG18_02610 [Legionella israelensis]
MSTNIVKIKLLLENKLNDSTLNHLLTLIRKELEGLNQSNVFNILKFYCDWTLHKSIGRSNAGSSVIANINQIVIIFSSQQNNDELIKAISTILIERFKSQLFQFLHERSIHTSFISHDAEWRNFLKILFSILENTPVLLCKKDKDILKAKPIKPGMWIEQITIIKCNFTPCVIESKELYSLDLLASDTTRIIVPLTPV